MSQSNESKYFDLHTTGIGYLNRIRDVKPKKGSGFLACTVAALHGDMNDAEYSYIDCVVSGSEAQKLVRRCTDAVEARKKVLISFRIGDTWADAYLKDGEPRAQLKGRLLFINWIKVDQIEVYHAPEREKAVDDTVHMPQSERTQAVGNDVPGEAHSHLSDQGHEQFDDSLDSSSEPVNQESVDPQLDSHAA